MYINVYNNIQYYIYIHTVYMLDDIILTYWCRLAL